MKNKEWDTNDWQGKRKEQIESSYKIAFYAIIGMGIVILISYFIDKI
jgi:hypothetical protein